MTLLTRDVWKPSRPFHRSLPFSISWLDRHDFGELAEAGSQRPQFGTVSVAGSETI
jgi:hypothetical protein